MYGHKNTNISILYGNYRRTHAKNAKNAKKLQY
jgi:hypothetical protein